MHRLLKESKKIKAQADMILKESDIVEILKDYGKVKISGSYALDVMLRPDLDLFVITEKHDWNKVIDIQSKIMNLKYFRDFNFANWVDFEDKTITPIKGYYFQPWVPINNQLWKMDIWLITSEYDRTTELTEHFKKLLDQEPDDIKRIAILEIKEAMKENKKYTKGINGKLIYKAVLENGITNVEDFNKFLRIQE
ncbi:MAG: hypothetical protein NTZ49_04040 [Candidatus Parcubacteria bacterium]|nr:hypothetical protein [Candidatus Parcubacteria bacterium]